MATLAVQATSRSGLLKSLAAAAVGGDEFVNTGSEFILIENASVGVITLTIATPQVIDTDLQVAERTVALAATSDYLIGPFPTGAYNDANAKVQLTYSGVTTLTIGIFKLGAL